MECELTTHFACHPVRAELPEAEGRRYLPQEGHHVQVLDPTTAGRREKIVGNIIIITTKTIASPSLSSSSLLVMANTTTTIIITEKHSLGLGIVFRPLPHKLVEVVRSEDRPITGEVVKVVHDDGNEEVDDLHRKSSSLSSTSSTTALRHRRHRRRQATHQE